MLTIENAKAYMENLLEGDGAEIVGAWEGTVHGVPVVTVKFLTKTKREEFADVWMQENGKLYGEW